MRIGVLSDFRSANTIYRAVPVVQLQLRSHRVAVDRGGERRDHPELHGCDVVHVYRYASATTQRFVRALRAAGTAVVWDVDDDLTAVPDEMRDRDRRGGLHEQRMVREAEAMAQLADVVTTTSEPIAAHYRARGAGCVRVVPNFLPDAFAAAAAAPRRRGDDAVVIGWIASAEHQHDLERLGLDATLRALLERRPQARVASVGIRFDLPPDRYAHTLVVQPAELPQTIAGFDVGIAPLNDIPFNRARSDVKVKEYAAVGVPWLASPIGPYAGLGEKQGGRLVADDGWLDALDRLVAKGRERRKLAKRAAAWGREQTASRNLGAWEAVMQEAVERAAARRAG
jgi:glycosyltransferase involved in cell wall biosynthesis